jgi:hypothetical protein
MYESSVSSLGAPGLRLIHNVQVPFMILGSILTSVGTGLLSQFRPDTPTLQWAGFLVTIGLGLGFGMQQPYTAVQVSLEYVNPPKTPHRSCLS